MLVCTLILLSEKMNSVSSVTFHFNMYEMSEKLLATLHEIRRRK